MDTFTSFPFLLHCLSWASPCRSRSGCGDWRVAAPSPGPTGLGSVWSQAGLLGDDFSVQAHFHF